VQIHLRNKHNLVLYIDKDLVAKSKSLGFNLSKTFENHLKHLITQFSTCNSASNFDSTSKIGRWWAGPDSNQRPSARQASGVSSEELLGKFREFLRVDLRRSKKTAYEHTYYMRRFLNELAMSPETVSSDDIRGYLKSLNVSSAQYKNILMAFKVFFRDFMKHPEVVESFRFPHQVYKPKHIVSKEDLRIFYKAIETSKEKALFLLYATSGLRRQEILSLKSEDIDFEKRIITPNNHFGETKKSWCSFYNEEAEEALNEYLATKNHSRSKRIFPMQRYEVVELWKSAKGEDGIGYYSTEA
jgi:integrase